MAVAIGATGTAEVASGVRIAARSTDPTVLGTVELGFIGVAAGAGPRITAGARATSGVPH